MNELRTDVTDAIYIFTHFQPMLTFHIIVTMKCKGRQLRDHASYKRC